MPLRPAVRALRGAPPDQRRVRQSVAPSKPRSARGARGSERIPDPLAWCDLLFGVRGGVWWCRRGEVGARCKRRCRGSLCRSVRTPAYGLPPHRSRRALLTHWAPASSAGFDHCRSFGLRWCRRTRCHRPRLGLSQSKSVQPEPRRAIERPFRSVRWRHDTDRFLGISTARALSRRLDRARLDHGVELLG